LISDYTHSRLRKNHGKRVPTTVLYLDTETYQKTKGDIEYHRMKVAWSCSMRYSSQGESLAEKWLEWKDPEKLWSYVQTLARAKSSLYIFAHNIFFDLQSSDFFYWFEKWGWSHEFSHENGLTFIFCIKKDDRRIKLLSTTNYFQVSLESIGELVGIPKGRVDFKTCSFQDLSTYCRQDVLILKRIMEFYFKFILDHDLGNFSMTRASQSFRAYRHRFMNEPIYIHDSLEVKELERLAYHGGRTEAFKWREQKQGPFLTLDVNSMYPFIMKHRKVPIQLIDYKENVPLRRVSRILTKFCVVAECVVKTDTPCYAVIYNDKLCFPTGKFITYLCTEGIEYAFKHGHIKKVNRLALYKSGYIFDDYVDFFYSLKRNYGREGNKPFEHISKYFLNSLYGKFGQKKTEEATRDYDTGGVYRKEKIYDLTRDLWIEQYYIMNKVINKYGSKDDPKSFAAIAAHITEGARFYLWDLIEKVGHDKVIYCDTDSLKIRKRDIEPLLPFIDREKLGCLKIEKRNRALDIRGAKNYIADGERKIKGVPKTAKQVGPFSYEYFTFFNQATHLNEGNSRWYKTQKTIKYVPPKYNKGTINPDGTIIPFRLSLHDLPSEPLQ